MLAVISPAKSLDFDSPLATRKATQPEFQKDSSQLIKVLRQLGPADLSELMGISAKLADLNYQRYADWQPDFSVANARPAALAFAGDVYNGLKAQQYSERDFNYAQKHLRILSGLHGLLRPLDLIQPYRLEMGTRLTTPRGKDLYGFWGKRVTQALNAALADGGGRFLINLASQEYFGVLQPDQIDGRVINVQFKDFKNGSYKFMSFYGKQARGLMASYIVQERVTSLKALRAFDWQGYYFSAADSSENDWVFLRDSVPA
ncbi:MAG: peroxide stress protein YaaA [Pseudomonadales bacterium]